MNRAQKIAWFNLASIACGFIVFALLAWILVADRVLVPNAGKISALALAYLCLVALGSRRLFLAEQGKVSIDERDEMIRKSASLVAYGTFFCVFSLIIMGLFFFLGPTGSISVAAIPLVWVSGLAFVIVVHSAAILVQYGWRNKHNE
jgi:hypothetical protein